MNVGKTIINNPQCHIFIGGIFAIPKWVVDYRFYHITMDYYLSIFLGLLWITISLHNHPMEIHVRNP